MPNHSVLPSSSYIYRWCPIAETARRSLNKLAQWRSHMVLRLTQHWTADLAREWKQTRSCQAGFWSFPPARLSGTYLKMPKLSCCKVVERQSELNQDYHKLQHCGSDQVAEDWHEMTLKFMPSNSDQWGDDIVAKRSSKDFTWVWWDLVGFIGPLFR